MKTDQCMILFTFHFCDPPRFVHININFTSEKLQILLCCITVWECLAFIILKNVIQCTNIPFIDDYSPG
jgi:hypothetical protein